MNNLSIQQDVPHDGLLVPGGSDAACRELRNALARFATGVTVITARDERGAALGLTVNSFASVSLDPPLILWSVALGANSADAFAAGARFVVNVLSVRQLPLALAFARQDATTRFDGCPVSVNADGVPFLDDCAAEYHCSVAARHPGGDHAIIVGRVHAFRAGSAAPLVFHDGRFCAPGAPLSR